MELFVFFISGLFVGSFLNVLADRLPRGENVLWGRSHCDFCHKTLRWFELIPVFSYALSGGRCLRCHKRLSLGYPLSELSTGIIFLLVGFFSTKYQPFLPLPGLLLSLTLASCFIVIFLADFRYQIIPDSMVIVGGLSVVFLHFLSGSQSVFINSSLAGLGVTGFFYLLYLFTKKRGLGLGDVKLGFLLGFWLGYPGIIVGLYVAFLTGAIVGVILILAGRKKLKSKIALGPFLLVGSVVSLLWSQQILRVFASFF